MKELLETARAQLAAGDASFYDSLRSAWRACRCVELAELLERAGRTTPWRGPAKSRKAWQAAWIATAREANPLVLGNLIDPLVEHGFGQAGSLVSACLDELAAVADDPQLTKSLLVLLGIRTLSTPWIKVQTRAFQLLEASLDPRAIDRVLPATERTAGELAASKAMAASVARGARTRERLQDKLPSGVPALPAELAPLVAELAATLASAKPIAAKPKVTDDADALLAAIYADPDDDAKRLVYADALMARGGDPRAELVVAQLAGTPEGAKRAATLLAKHRRALLGALAKAVTASTAVFERGFLARCSAGVSRRLEIDAVFDRPEWSTVTHLELTHHSKLAPAMRVLTDLRVVPETDCRALATMAFPRIAVLRISPFAHDTHTVDVATSQLLRAITKTTGLPGLRELRLEHHPAYAQPHVLHDWAWIFEAPFAPQLEVVEIAASSAVLVSMWLARLAELPRWRELVANMRMRDGQALRAGVVTVTRRGRAFAATLSVTGERPLTQAMCDELCDGLAGAGVVVETSPGRDPASTPEP